VIVALVGMAVALGIGACAGSGAVTSTTVAAIATTDLAPGSLGTAGSTTSSLHGAAPSPTDITLPPTTAPGLTGDTEANGPSTTVLTGTTLPGGGQMFSLTFVGPMTPESWNALRTAVNSAKDDGDKVRIAVAKLTAGADVNISSAQFDRFSGIGFSAGANTAQPVAIATGSGGEQILAYAFTITGKPASTTIVGFDLQTGHVGLVVGPLKITDQTKNITTIPGQ
jgi:hypothetical protein